MKTRMARMLLLLLLALAGGLPSAQAFYNPTAGKWVNRDPLGEPGFGLLHNLASFDTSPASEDVLEFDLDQPDILSADESPLCEGNPYLGMGDKAFVFYFPAFSRFLESTHADGDADGLNSLASIIGFRVEHEPQSIADTKEPILSALQYCVDNYPKFGVEKTIYGDLRGKLLRLQKIVTELNPPVSRQAG